MEKRKKALFDLSSLGSVAIVLVIAAIVIAMGGTILKDIQTGSDDGSNNTAYNVSGYGLASVTSLSKWLPTIAI